MSGYVLSGTLQQLGSKLLKLASRRHTAQDMNGAGTQKTVLKLKQMGGQWYIKAVKKPVLVDARSSVSWRVGKAAQVTAAVSAEQVRSLYPW